MRPLSEEELPLSADDEPLDEVLDEESVPLSVLLLSVLLLSVVPVSVDPVSELEPELELLLVPLAVVSASACMVPTRANTPAAAASVTAAARAAVRRAPLRTAAAAPVPLPWSP